MKKEESSFVIKFVIVYLLAVFCNKLFIGLTIPGGLYSSFFSEYLNYADFLRNMILHLSQLLLAIFGVKAELYNKYYLIAESGHGVRMIYSCIGINLLLLWATFVAVYPINRKYKPILFVIGISAIFLLNITRVSLLVAGVDLGISKTFDAHFVFNLFVYACLGGLVLLVVNNDRFIKGESTKLS